MTAFADLVGLFVLVWLVGLVTAYIWVVYKKFEPNIAYYRYYDAYRLKVLKDELKKKGVTFEELDLLGLKLFADRKRKVHTLDEIEQSVKGELKKVSDKK